MLLAPYIPRVWLSLSAQFSSLAPCHRACQPAAKCKRYSLTGPKDRLYPAHDSIREPDLDPVRMSRRVRQDIPDDSFGEFAGSLILLLYDLHPHAGPDVRSLCSVHILILAKPQQLTAENTARPAGRNQTGFSYERQATMKRWIWTKGRPR